MKMVNTYQIRTKQKADMKRLNKKYSYLDYKELDKVWTVERREQWSRLSQESHDKILRKHCKPPQATLEQDVDIDL